MKTLGAFLAWSLAIQSFMKPGETYPANESIEDRAKQYGSGITDAEHLETVSHWFNWDIITKALREKT